MKKFSLAFFLLSILIRAQEGSAQGISFTRDDGRGGRLTATWQRPLPQGNTIFDICFVDSRHGWAVGEHGTILHTTNGGESWSAQSSGTTEALFECSFIDREHGWVNGVQILLRTTDGGRHWSSTHAPPLQGAVDNFRSACMPASGTVIVTTGFGGIWRSTDNGEEWRQVHELSDPDHMYFTDEKYGWVAGESGRIIRTTDGGATWTDHWALSQGRWPMMLSFSDSLRGWVSTEQISVSATTDGGRTWSVAIKDTMMYRNDMAMIDSLHGWSCGVRGLFRTSDGGRSWTPHPSVTSRQLNAITFRNADSGWVAGYFGVLLRTTDGGETWLNEYTVWMSDFRALDFPSEDSGWVVGNGIYRTTDGGMNWLSIPHPGSGTLTGAFFFDGRSGVCIGKDGLVISTTDAGSTWARQTIAPGQLLSDVFFLDRERGWIATHEGSIFHTRDGGGSWRLLADGFPADLEEVAFTNPRTGHATCLNEGFWSTRDGGATWSSQTFGCALVDMALPDSSTIILLSSFDLADKKRSALILRSTDGGATWRPRRIEAAVYPRALHFTDARRGWLLAENGSVWTTEDGGASWTPLPSATGIWGVDIAAPTSRRAFIASGNGGIVRIDWTRAE